MLPALVRSNLTTPKLPFSHTTLLGPDFPLDRAVCLEALLLPLLSVLHHSSATSVLNLLACAGLSLLGSRARIYFWFVVHSLLALIPCVFL